MCKTHLATLENVVTHSLYKSFLAVLFSLLIPLLAGCNTMEGLGEDTEAAGDTNEAEADQEEEDYPGSGVGL
jgi:predicted small secreted protein